MIYFRNFFVVFCFLFGSVSFYGAEMTSTFPSKKGCKQNCISFEDHFRLLQFFKTPNQYLTFLKNLKLITAADFTEMSVELTKLGLLDTVVSDWPILKDQIIYLNKIKIARLSDSVFFKSPSVHLKISSKLSFKENYLNFANELSEKKQTSWFNILFANSAFAAPNNSTQEAALISLSTVAASLYSGVEVVGTCLPGVLISAAGQLSQVVKSIIHPFRRMIYNGNVQCVRGEYFLHQPQLVYYDTIAKYKEHYDWITKYDKDTLNKVYGVCYALVNSGDKTVADAIEQFNCEKPECIKPISKSEVSRILNKSLADTPKCDSETAKKVENFKHQQAAKIESDILQALVSDPQAEISARPSGIDPDKGESISGQR
jgi:hypothetical protein